MESKTTPGGALCDLAVVMQAGNRLPCAPKLQYEGLEKNIFLNAKSKKARNVPKVKYGKKVHFSPRANRVSCSEDILGNAAASYVFLSQTRTKKYLLFGERFCDTILSFDQKFLLHIYPDIQLNRAHDSRRRPVLQASYCCVRLSSLR